MNITILTNILPYPLSSGGAQAQFNMIDALRKEHKISIVFTEDGRNRLSAMRTLEGLWPEVKFFPFRYARQMLYPRFVADKAVRALKLKLIPDSVRFQAERALMPYGVYFSADFKRFVNRIVRETAADIVQVEFFPCLAAAECLPKDVKKIFIHHEIRFIRNRRLLQGFDLTPKEIRQEEDVKRQEIRRLNLYDAVVTLTNADKDILTSNGVSVPVYVSPAAVNARMMPYKEWNGDVIFIGGYGHLPNKEGVDWFIDKVLSRMSADIRFKIIGAGWPRSYEQKSGNVELLGFVDKLEDAACGAIMVVPILTGSGMRMKILETAAMSVPFVTTSVGVEGLDFKDEESCLVADSPADFAAALQRLMSDALLRKRLAANASAVFEEKYSVKTLSGIRDSIYRSILN